MRLMLHTLQKDLRRLWPPVLVTWIMLLTLARADRWRGDWIPSALEGWMTMLLTMAWACLTTLAIQEEPPVGDRNFWTTRPHRWPSLLAAKFVFVALAIHLPAFLADVYILASRGFSPFAYLPDLFWKQILLFGAITLPSVALASLVRSFTHFVIVAFLIATGILILNGGFQSYPEFIPQQYELHHALERIVLAAASVAVIWIQYARRSTLPARAIAICATLAAVAIAAWLPARAEYTVGAAPNPPGISLRNAPLDAGSDMPPDGPVMVSVPLAIDFGARSDPYHIPDVDIEITASDGIRLQSVRSSPNRPFQKIDLWALIAAPPDRPAAVSLNLRFSRTAWERIKNASAHIRGAAAFEFYRSGPTTSFPTQGTTTIPGIGRCTSLVAEQNYNDGALKVECESPRELPAASLRLRHESSGRQWGMQRLSLPGRLLSGPHDTWLSPLQRRQSSFSLTYATNPSPSGWWLVPIALLPATHLEITPEIPTGRTLAHFDFADVPLAQWLVPQRRPVP